MSGSAKVGPDPAPFGPGAWRWDEGPFGGSVPLPFGVAMPVLVMGLSKIDGSGERIWEVQLGWPRGMAGLRCDRPESVLSDGAGIDPRWTDEEAERAIGARAADMERRRIEGAAAEPCAEPVPRRVSGP